MKFKLISLLSAATLLMSAQAFADNVQSPQIVCASGTSAATLATNLNSQLAALGPNISVTNPIALPAYSGNLSACVTATIYKQ